VSTYALVHGAGGSGWDWHLLEAELRARGHRVMAPDLSTDDSATLSDYADAVTEAVGDSDDLVVVGHSFGAFTVPLVADRRPVSGLVLIAGMVPRPGEAPADWWTSTGYAEAVQRQAVADGGLTGNDDPVVCYYHDVPGPMSAQALVRERAHPGTKAYTDPWPLHGWPDVPTRFVVCTEDRLFPAGFLRQVALDRLGVTPDELVSGHCPALGHPEELAALLSSYPFAR
jgi:pimeloyl-ACP methyl ester carboxylesterase